MFDPVDPRQSFPDLERGILSYWKEEDMFHRSIDIRKNSESFTFYDGPPFATGLPHYGHLLAGTIKDVIPRYQTMRGRKVMRRFGWDCHGLPVENLIEKEHNIRTKREIEVMGVRRFNELCRGVVQRYVKEWRTTVERTGRWVDMDWDYRTMDPPYMESIWWVFKSLADRNLLYEGHKPMHICPHCVTPLSNFEVTQGYKDITDLSVTVQFQLTGKPGTYLLAWTTTPWTLPGNLFVAVGPEIRYVNVSHEGKTYIVAEDRLETVFKDTEYEVTGKAFKGEKLNGMQYTPLFPYFADEYADTAFRVVTADFVSTEDGTGLVHIAPGFGEDDFAIGKREKVKLLQHVTMEGVFVPAVRDFAGMDVKPIDDPSKADRKVADWLEEHGGLFARENYRHSYPHCWRCDSPLLNYATSSWFVRVEQLKKDMLDANAKTEWVPAHLRDGRFGNWLENARDWAISRNRYWGTPLPIWRPMTSTGQADQSATEYDVLGSRDDVMRRQLIRFTKVTAVRHGEGEHNVGHYYNSREPGANLTDTGRQQAQQAGEFLRDQQVSVIYCSPLARTRQTAQAIADATGARIVIDERLREVDVGEHEGKGFNFSDMDLMKLKRQQKLQENSPDSVYHLEGMEKWTSVEKRVKEFFDEILPRHRSEHVVVVSHGDPISCMRHYFTKEDPFKLSHRPMAAYATPEQFYWDHDTGAEMDLHKENMDEIMWANPGARSGVDVICVRHGETELNRRKIMQGGNIDEPLNDTGREQAEKTAALLKKEKFDLIICSGLSRAQETARIIAAETGHTEIETLPLLNERDAGEWSGKTIDDVLAVHPAVGEDMSVAMHYATPPGGESLAAFLKRVRKAYEQILAKHDGKKILLVAHRGTILALQTLTDNLGFAEAACRPVNNAEALRLTLKPFMKRIPDVLDCWFESGSMPYAQQHFPFELAHAAQTSVAPPFATGRGAAGDSSSDANLPHGNGSYPPGFPADFIAEGIDQTRGWFYTLTVLSSALYKEPAFRNCVVNGIVLAEDGRKMSKRLKNYPEPTELVEKHGADALRFTLMRSPAVRGEDLRFSEKMVEETVRNMLLPLWNSYSFFVTYANLAKFQPVARPKASAHPLDRWIKAEVQDLVNRMTEQLDAYDLSATCEELFETIDALTNWYIRLSRRRFAGKGLVTDIAEAEPENFEEDRIDALNTLYDVLITVSQVLAPFCPFMTDAIYLNLVPETHGSIHLTDWPAARELTKEEERLVHTQRLLRRIVSLGLKLRSDKKIKNRQPLAKATVAYPPSLQTVRLGEEETALLRQELNVKEIVFTDDPGSLGEAYVQVDARKVGPRLGKRVQDIIQAGKRGEFEEMPDGSIVIMDETLTPDEAAILYRSRGGGDIAAERGTVVSLDTTVTDELKLEGLARDLIRGIQQLRKDQGYELGEPVKVGIKGADDILQVHRQLIEQETGVLPGATDGPAHVMKIGEDLEVTVIMSPKG